jgi:acyl-CoA synthetase (AMP-forming)/AMP-acid ligase II
LNLNLANFLLSRAELRPELRLGVVGQQVTLGDAIDVGRRIAGDLAAAGLAAGDRIAVVDHTSTDYLVFWIGCQLAGVEPALINPTYPDDLLAPMLDVLRPDAVATAEGLTRTDGRPAIGFGGVVGSGLRLDGRPLPGAPAAQFPGLDRDELAIAGFMHTSGTTGLPKFCAQSHRYYLQLGRLVADELSLNPDDRVLAPLPMFHVNPLGYGFMGALTGMSDLLAVERFSASGFWPMVKDEGVTALVLHAPPVEIIKRRTTPEDAAGHRVRAMFYADEDFLIGFGIPVAMSCYGSTEVGGLSHVWQWRRGERAGIPEGMSHYAGRPRYDIDYRLTDDGEILIRGNEPGAIFAGYLRDGVIDPSVDEEGWFHTGDLGRMDETGRLIFIERAAQSIRSKGEFVPIDHVEQTFSSIAAFDDLALWKRPGELRDEEEVILFVVGDQVPMDQVAACSETLPKFMRPVAVARVAAIPRDAGAGKVQRNRLLPEDVLEWFPC